MDRDAYDAAVEAVDKGRFEPKIASVCFRLDGFAADPAGTNAKLLEALHG